MSSSDENLYHRICNLIFFCTTYEPVRNTEPSPESFVQEHINWFEVATDFLREQREEYNLFRNNGRSTDSRL